MKKVLLIYPGNESLGEKIIAGSGCEKADFALRFFPDGEIYFRLISDVTDKYVSILCTLDRPNEKILPLFFMAQIAREQGAAQVRLIAPYLAYMRQDNAFHPGESVVAKHFASLLSACFDSLVTVDPHLHRIRSLDEIYHLPVKTFHSAPLIASWIRHYIPQGFLIGPDGESRQWVTEVANAGGCPYIIGGKVRMGDRSVRVDLPDLRHFHHLTPILIDDIISTGDTMKKIIYRLRELELRAPVCIAVHAVFSGTAYQELLAAGAARVVTCNTISHPSNGIDISGYLAP